MAKKKNKQKNHFALHRKVKWVKGCRSVKHAEEVVSDDSKSVTLNSSPEAKQSSRWRTDLNAESYRTSCLTLTSAGDQFDFSFIFFYLFFYNPHLLTPDSCSRHFRRATNPKRTWLIVQGNIIEHADSDLVGGWLRCLSLAKWAVHVVRSLSTSLV